MFNIRSTMLAILLSSILHTGTALGQTTTDQPTMLPLDGKPPSPFAVAIANPAEITNLLDSGTISEILAAANSNHQLVRVKTNGRTTNIGWIASDYGKSLDVCDCASSELIRGVSKDSVEVYNGICKHSFEPPTIYSGVKAKLASVSDTEATFEVELPKDQGSFVATIDRAVTVSFAINSNQEAFWKSPYLKSKLGEEWALSIPRDAFIPKGRDSWEGWFRGFSGTFSNRMPAPQVIKQGFDLEIPKTGDILIYTIDSNTEIPQSGVMTAQSAMKTVELMKKNGLGAAILRADVPNESIAAKSDANICKARAAVHGIPIEELRKRVMFEWKKPDMK